MAPEQQFQKRVLTTLEHLDKDMETIKKQVNALAMFLEDSTLTEEEKKLLEETLEDKKAGRLIPLEKVKKKFNLQ